MILDSLKDIAAHPYTKPLALVVVVILAGFAGLAWQQGLLNPTGTTPLIQRAQLAPSAQRSLFALLYEATIGSVATRKI